jgi:hypothetical protein
MRQKHLSYLEQVEVKMFVPLLALICLKPSIKIASLASLVPRKNNRVVMDNGKRLIATVAATTFILAHYVTGEVCKDKGRCSPDYKIELTTFPISSRTSPTLTQMAMLYQKSIATF